MIFRLFMDCDVHKIIILMIRLARKCFHEKVIIVSSNSDSFDTDFISLKSPDFVPVPPRVAFNGMGYARIENNLFIIHSSRCGNFTVRIYLNKPTTLPQSHTYMYSACILAALSHQQIFNHNNMLPAHTEANFTCAVYPPCMYSVETSVQHTYIQYIEWMLIRHTNMQQKRSEYDTCASLLVSNHACLGNSPFRTFCISDYGTVFRTSSDHGRDR